MDLVIWCRQCQYTVIADPTKTITCPRCGSADLGARQPWQNRVPEPIVIEVLDEEKSAVALPSSVQAAIPEEVTLAKIISMIAAWVRAVSTRTRKKSQERKEQQKEAEQKQRELRRQEQENYERRMRIKEEVALPARVQMLAQGRGEEPKGKDQQHALECKPLYFPPPFFGRAPRGEVAIDIPKEVMGTPLKIILFNGRVEALLNKDSETLISLWLYGAADWGQIQEYVEFFVEHYFWQRISNFSEGHKDQIEQINKEFFRDRKISGSRGRNPTDAVPRPSYRVRYAPSGSCSVLIPRDVMGTNCRLLLEDGQIRAVMDMNGEDITYHWSWASWLPLIKYAEKFFRDGNMPNIEHVEPLKRLVINNDAPLPNVCFENAPQGDFSVEIPKLVNGTPAIVLLRDGRLETILDKDGNDLLPALQGSVLEQCLKQYRNYVEHFLSLWIPNLSQENERALIDYINKAYVEGASGVTSRSADSLSVTFDAPILHGECIRVDTPPDQNYQLFLVKSNSRKVLRLTSVQRLLQDETPFEIVVEGLSLREMMHPSLVPGRFIFWSPYSRVYYVAVPSGKKVQEVLEEVRIKARSRPDVLNDNDNLLFARALPNGYRVVTLNEYRSTD